MGLVRLSLRVAIDSAKRFLADDCWAIASHIALSTLMALFPFLLVVTAFAGTLGSKGLADEAARIMLDMWPAEVAGPIGTEIQDVLATARGNVFTIGLVLALYFSSSGVESLRIGLNRAYGVVDSRPWWLLRLESIAYVLVGALALLAFAFLVLLAPLILRTLVRHIPSLEPFGNVITLVRFGVAALVLIVALFIAHLWLPAGRRKLREITPGILVTLLLWLVSGTMFGRYLAEYAFGYSVYYAGLASVMIALVFLYFSASIFVYGGELNATIRRFRMRGQLAGDSVKRS